MEVFNFSSLKILTLNKLVISIFILIAFLSLDANVFLLRQDDCFKLQGLVLFGNLSKSGDHLLTLSRQGNQKSMAHLDLPD